MSLATLGAGDTAVTFEVSADRVRTWSEAKRSGEARWARHDVHGSKPLSEFLGPGLDSITLSVRFDLGMGVVPRDELRNLRTLRDTGAVSAFVVGGELVADFAVKGLSETWQHFDGRGVLTAAVVEISLEEYH